MVKCPKATLQQINANLEFLNLIRSCSDHNQQESGGDLIESEFAAEEQHYYRDDEFDDVRADKRNPPTVEDEITSIFVYHFLEIILKCWDGTPCLKPKLGKPPEENIPSTEFSEFGETFGEEYSYQSDKAPSMNMSDYLNEMNKTRSQRLSNKTPLEKERLSLENTASAICKKCCDSRRSIVSEVGESEVDGEFMRTLDSENLWQSSVPDEDVHMILQNGIWYQGRVSRRLMDGDGTFFWEDGARYMGQFIGGNITGKGVLEFSDLDIYEGTLRNGYRDGYGLQCRREPDVTYSGTWCMGKKHGEGVILYQDPTQVHDFYWGGWFNGKKDGFGYRQYPSGSKYIGFWQNGKRHGAGIMFFYNFDIYRGQWKDGLMHGFGEYTWNAFYNKNFSYPRVNTYRGFWAFGKRNGGGILELSNSAYIETTWEDDEKSGAGAVACANGAIIVAERLFKSDKPALIDPEEKDCTGLLFRDTGNENVKKKKDSKDSIKLRNDAQLISFLTSVEKAKAISIPIHTPNHALDLSPHLLRLQNQREELFQRHSEQLSAFGGKKTPRLESISNAKLSNMNSLNQLSEIYALEENLLRYCIMIHYTKLKAHYDAWAMVARLDNQEYKCTLLRIFFWEMLIQSDVPSRNFSLVDIDDILASVESFLIESSHYPFERIQFWQYIHFLITISWYMYGQHIYAESVKALNKNVELFLETFYKHPDKTVLSVAFGFFIEHHIFRDKKNCIKRGTEVFIKCNIVPIEAMYLAYKNVGEPHSAKKFLCSIFVHQNEGQRTEELVSSFGKFPYYKYEVHTKDDDSGQLSYLPTDGPFNHPEMFLMAREITTEESNLHYFSHLKPKDVVNCLVQVCPSIIEDGVLVDMECQLTFLEFCKAVLACCEFSIKQRKLKEMEGDIVRKYEEELEAYERKLKEYEHKKELQTNLSKKTSHSKRMKK